MKGRKVIVPDFNKFVSLNETIETDKEDHVKEFLLGKGKVVRFELRQSPKGKVRLCLCSVPYDEKFNNKKWIDIEKMCPIKECKIGQLLEDTIDEPEELIYMQNFQIVLGILTVAEEISGLNFYHPAFKDGNLFIVDSQINDFPEIQSIHFYC